MVMISEIKYIVECMLIVRLLMQTIKNFISTVILYYVMPIH